MRCTVQIATDGGDENDQGCLGTAMHAVNAIPPDRNPTPPRLPTP